MNDDGLGGEFPLAEIDPAAESDLIEILDLPSWIGVAVGLLLVLIAAVAVWQVS